MLATWDAATYSKRAVVGHYVYHPEQIIGHAIYGMTMLQHMQSPLVPLTQSQHPKELTDEDY